VPGQSPVPPGRGRRSGLELSIDTAGPIAGVALTDGGELVADLAWRAHAGHAAELLPAVDLLLARAGASRETLEAIFVCRGPGGYAGLRVGISTAMALAFGLGAGLLAVGRLEADAYPHAAYPGAIVPVHAAGRGELAWAVYAAARPDPGTPERARNGDVAGWRETAPPRLTWQDALIAEAPRQALICGEVDDELADMLRAARPDLRLVRGPAFARRAVTLAALAWPRYRAGARDSHLALEPIYLREPSIGARGQGTGNHGDDGRG
jgi:tRNA threonylcarbamoyl adenosine modification protein YeaZ